MVNNYEFYILNLLFVDQDKMANSSNKEHPWFEICHPPGIIYTFKNYKFIILFKVHIIVNGIKIFLNLNFH
jgi:hypothetical protein